jgi:hypothetical protein
VYDLGVCHSLEIEGVELLQHLGHPGANLVALAT